MTDTMRALVIRGPRTARVEEVPIPAPGAGQVVVDVRRVGICGTDIELFTGEMAYYAQGKARFPLRPGHEWCGTVSALGEGVDAAWYGARVTGDTMLGCGRCDRCRTGRGHVCADRYELGILGGWPGALAEKVLVPVTSLHRLPDAVDDRTGALVEPGGNAWRAAAAALDGWGVAPGARILVWGAGTIGLLTAAFAHAAGAEVHVLALDRTRQDLAHSLGADRFWTPGALPGYQFSAVIDCTDDASTPAAAMERVEPAGRLVFIGLSRTPSVIDTRHLVLNDITAVGILGASDGLQAAIAHYADRRVVPGPLVKATVGLDRAAEALAGRLPDAPGTKIHIDPAV